MSGIDLVKLRRSWQLRSGSMSLLLHTVVGAELDGARIRAVSAEVSARLAPANPVYALTWLQVPDGFAGLLLGATSVDVGTEWLRLFLEVLEDPGAQVTGLTGQSGPRFRRGEPNGLLACAAFRAPGDNDPSVRTNWTLDPDRTRSVAQDAQDWITAHEERLAVSWDYNQSFEITDPELGISASEWLQYVSGFYFRGWTTKPRRQRAFDMGRPSMVTWSINDPALDWGDAVAELTTLLRTYADDLLFGFVARAVAFPHPGPLQVAARLPYPNSNLVFDYPATATQVADVYGVQILRPAHLEQLGDLDGWDVTHLSPHTALVTSQDPAAWYANPAPDPKTLERARTQLAPIINTGHTD